LSPLSWRAPSFQFPNGYCSKQKPWSVWSIHTLPLGISLPMFCYAETFPLPSVYLVSLCFFFSVTWLPDLAKQNHLRSMLLSGPWLLGSKVNSGIFNLY
jgi:hypothetical protein